MNKTVARNKCKAARNILSQEEIENKSLAIANQLLRMDIWGKLYYHLFLTIDEQKEINTEYILHILAGKDKDNLLRIARAAGLPYNVDLSDENAPLIATILLLAVSVQR